jgi:omega-6 fatty acid desaturase (delta-12 desaturase)
MSIERREYPDDGLMPELQGTLARKLRPFARPATPRALWQLANTVIPFVALWSIMAFSRHAGWHYLWTLALAPAAAAFYVRLFILQHDCGHGSFFGSRRANQWLGSALGLVTLFPFAYWKKTHDVHHATSGDLDRRLLGDITTLTVAEYRALSRWGKFCYRMYRSMPIMLVVGPIYQFVAKHRLPIGMPWRWTREWRSVALNNLALVCLVGALGTWLGWRVLLEVHLPVISLAGAAGVWLFYVQHTFEGGYWARGAGWHPQRAAIAGSSFYDLPPMLRWFTANIGYHHIHHLAPRIPNYNLRAAHEATPDLPGLKRLGLRESLRSARLKLWSEELSCLVDYSILRGAGTVRGTSACPPPGAPGS